MGMGIRCWDWLDDMSSPQPIGLSSEEVILNRTIPDTIESIIMHHFSTELLSTSDSMLIPIFKH